MGRDAEEAVDWEKSWWVGEQGSAGSLVVRRCAVKALLVGVACGESAGFASLIWMAETQGRLAEARLTLG